MQLIKTKQRIWLEDSECEKHTCIGCDLEHVQGKNHTIIVTNEIQQTRLLGYECLVADIIIINQDSKSLFYQNHHCEMNIACMM